MTEEEAKEFFDEYGDRVIQLTRLEGDTYVSIEQIFQAVKARLKSEATCNCWAKEAVENVNN